MRCYVSEWPRPPPTVDGFFTVGGEGTTWYGAAARCRSYGGNLASIKSAEQNELAKSFAAGAGRVLWIGATDAMRNTGWPASFNAASRGGWQWWADGTQLPAQSGSWATYFFDDRKSNNGIGLEWGQDCAAISGNGRWYDFDCNDAPHVSGGNSDNGFDMFFPLCQGPEPTKNLSCPERFQPCYRPLDYLLPSPPAMPPVSSPPAAPPAPSVPRGAVVIEAAPPATCLLRPSEREARCRCEYVWGGGGAATTSVMKTCMGAVGAAIDVSQFETDPAALGLGVDGEDGGAHSTGMVVGVAVSTLVVGAALGAAAVKYVCARQKQRGGGFPTVTAADKNPSPWAMTSVTSEE